MGLGLLAGLILFTQTGDLLVSGLVAAVFVGLALYALWQPKPPAPGSTWVEHEITYTPRGVLPPKFYRDPTDPFRGSGGTGEW